VRSRTGHGSNGAFNTRSNAIETRVSPRVDETKRRSVCFEFGIDDTRREGTREEGDSVYRFPAGELAVPRRG